MRKETITIDYLYEYEIEAVLDGGMGKVFIMSLLDSHRRGFTHNVLGFSEMLQNRYNYPYRQRLAAKTVKDNGAKASFIRECNIWLTFHESGVVPLLKVVTVRDMVLALMPRYDGNFRSLMDLRPTKPSQLLKSLLQPATGLATVHEKHGVVHQDIKPENLLYERKEDSFSLLVSDWGIANTKASLQHKVGVGLHHLAKTTMTGWGTEPYMAPERFENYISDIRADIFSLGVVFFEVLTQGLPYDYNRSFMEQIITGEYYFRAQKAMSDFPRSFSRMVLSMIHPAKESRLSGYKPILKFLRSL